jgi:hypothetical protein
VNGYDDPPIIAGAGTIGMEVSAGLSDERNSFSKKKFFSKLHVFDEDYRGCPRSGCRRGSHWGRWPYCGGLLCDKDPETRLQGA